MFGFVCRSAYPHGPWSWKTDGGGPVRGASPRLPRGLLGGQTVVLLTVWATALICGVALAGPPCAATRAGGVDAAAAVPEPAGGPASGPASEPPAPPPVVPSASADAGSDAADLAGDRTFGEEELGLE